MSNTLAEELFVTKTIDEKWIWFVENRVPKWINKYNKSYWEMVRFHGIYNSILEDSISRIEFGRLIIEKCHNAVQEGEIETRMKQSMDIFPYISQLKNYDKLPDAHVCRTLMRELEEMYNQPLPVNFSTPTRSIEDLLQEYINSSIATDGNTLVCKHQEYCGFISTLSVEQYVAQKFITSRTPTSIMVFECIDGQVTEQTVSTLSGQYAIDRKIKLVIVSSSSFDKRTIAVAKARDVALMKIDPNYKVTENNWILPRSEVDTLTVKAKERMLNGEQQMNVPIVVNDVIYSTSFLPMLLKRNGINIKEEVIVRAPFLSQREIEEEAMKLIQTEVNSYLEKLNSSRPGDTPEKFIVDPYKLARKLGLNIERTNLSSQHHEGHIDMRSNTISLSDRKNRNEKRDRYSASHEIGHHVLHSRPEFKEFIEKEAALAEKAAADSREQHWLEYHANMFASCLLMPTPIVVRLYDIYWKKWFHAPFACPLHIKGDCYHHKDFQNVVGPLARKFNVSLEAMKYRLTNLNLLITE